MRSQNAVVALSIGARDVEAALLTRMSRPPKRSTAPWTSDRQTASSARSPCRKAASPPRERIVSIRRVPACVSRPWTTTRAPSEAKCSAIPLPMPEVEPVMRATRLTRVGMSVSLTSTGRAPT
jgi:hypothetical protein